MSEFLIFSLYMLVVIFVIFISAPLLCFVQDVLVLSYAFFVAFAERLHFVRVSVAALP